MVLIKNMALFFLGFLPVVAVASMMLAGVFGDHIESSPQWKLGWNPFLWLIMTAPWLLPTAAVVPLLHFLGKSVSRRPPESWLAASFWVLRRYYSWRRTWHCGDRRTSDGILCFLWLCPHRYTAPCYESPTEGGKFSTAAAA